MMDDKDNNHQADIAQYSFEKALKELEAIVQQLEQHEVNLEDAISKYERADQLRQHCERKLQEAKVKIDKITLKADSNEETIVTSEEVTDSYL